MGAWRMHSSSLCILIILRELNLATSTHTLLYVLSGAAAESRKTYHYGVSTILTARNGRLGMVMFSQGSRVSRSLDRSHGLVPLPPVQLQAGGTHLT